MLGGSLGLPKAGAALKGSQGDPLLGGVPGPRSGGGYPWPRNPREARAVEGASERAEAEERSDEARGANAATLEWPELGGVPGPPKAGAALKGSLQRGGERTERSEVKRERVSGANEATSK